MLGTKTDRAGRALVGPLLNVVDARATGFSPRMNDRMTLQLDNGGCSDYRNVTLVVLHPTCSRARPDHSAPGFYVNALLGLNRRRVSFQTAGPKRRYGTSPRQ